MNAQNPGIPPTVRRAEDYLIPLVPLAPTLIERLAASHAAVLEKWNLNFALDLRRPRTPSVPLPIA
jgi:hypothetical protein